ncbi:NAD(+) diphosphatase [Roseovarius salinarum]|uniref:NAD(+) diphosphatase n=1 Tax=Roseovarius salinarum TaxID=1981892 RepID=UPI000C328E84|nr:NAD(+) diphosphatase [Roseovarius salinarum]
MRQAEAVTFGGSGLDRAAELRGDPDALQVAVSGGAKTLLVWRGKLLAAGANRGRVARLPMEHPVARQLAGAPVLLGREADGTLCFAHDISAWEPEGLDPALLRRFADPSEQRHPELPPDTAFVDLRHIMTGLDARDAELAATAKAILGWHSSHRFCARCGAESRMVEAGWQRLCDACGGRHFPRTDPVVIMLITRGNAVLLGRSPPWPEGMYSLLAGFVEPGETPEAAVRREVMEEAGIDVGRVRYLASQPWAFPSSLMIGCHGEALSREITLDPEELEDAMWVSREQVLASLAGTHPMLKAAREGAIAHFLLRNWLADTLD